MRSDIALYARAQDASELDVVRRHVARNAALPALTIQFASTGELFGGSAEQVFSYPGLGQATVDAGNRGDVPLLLAITILTTACVSFGNVLAITHDLAAVLPIADRVTLLREGAGIETAPAAAFAGTGDGQRTSYARALWRALPQNAFAGPDVRSVA